MCFLTGTCAEGKRGGAEQSFQMNRQTRNYIWDELRSQRHTVVEQKVELRNTKTRFQSLKDNAAGQKLKKAKHIQFFHNVCKIIPL